MIDVPVIRSLDGKTEERINWGDWYSSTGINNQLNSAYEITFTLTYQKGYERVFNLAKQPKAWVIYDGQWYVIQQVEPKQDDHGFTQVQVTANHSLIDKLKNLRVDADPESTTTDDSKSDSSDDSGNDDNQQGTTVVTKPTDQQQTYSLDDRLNQFFNNNDQGINYQLHGNFSQAAVDVSGSCYDWITSNADQFHYVWIPDGNTLQIYTYESLKHQTGKTFRYMQNMTTADVQVDVNDLVNDVQVYAGKMEQTTTTSSGPVSQNAQGLISYARSWLGKPYILGGKTEAGSDCAGFVHFCYAKMGVNIGWTTYTQVGSFHQVSSAQTGDVGFYGSLSAPYHVCLFLDANTIIYEPQEGESCKEIPVGNYPPSWIGRNDQMASIMNGGSSAGDSSSTTKEYYQIKYEYKDEDSIKRYRLHRGEPITADSIYDKNVLNDYLKTAVQSEPPTTLTITSVATKNFKLGDVWHLVATELNLDTDVMLVGVQMNPINHESATLTFNNTGLAMKDIYMALYNDIRNTNSRVNSINLLGQTGGRQEDHFEGITTVSASDMAKAKQLTETGVKS